MRRSGAGIWAGVLFALALAAQPAPASEPAGAQLFRQHIEPILTEFCYDCHGGGMATAKVAFDDFKSDRDLLENRELWWKALKQLRAGPKGSAAITLIGKLSRFLRPSRATPGPYSGWRLPDKDDDCDNERADRRKYVTHC